jgi:hypothetical protein
VEPSETQEEPIIFREFPWEGLTVDTDWFSDKRKIPDEAMSYIRKIAVQAIVESKFSPTTVAAVLKISLSSIYAWLDWYNRGGYDALDTAKAPGAEPRITQEMDELIKEIRLFLRFRRLLSFCNIVKISL